MKHNKLLIICISILIMASSFFSMRSFGLSNYLKVVAPLMLTVTIIFSMIFMLKCLKWYTNYMMLNKSLFNVDVDRPKVYIFSLILPLLGLLTYILNYYKASTSFDSLDTIIDVLICSVFVVLFFVLCLLLVFSISKRFEIVYLPKLKDSVKKVNNKKKIIISHQSTALLFDNLINNDFMVYTDLEEQNKMKSKFIEVMQKGELLENQIFTLEMNNIQTKLFQKELKKISNKFTLNFVMSVFKNENGTPTSDSVSRAYDGRKVDLVSRENDIINLFKLD